jgi:phosphoserine phosphatase RsbU/P
VKILVVEDDKISNMVICTKLTKLGHEVVSAKDGRDGWYAYLRENPKIIITDWMMPVTDGVELCRMVRADRRMRYTYIIMLTALSGKEKFIEAMNAGADDFITKPIDQNSLRARLRVAERLVNLQSEANELEGLLPICSYCKKIKDGQGVWLPVEQYVGQRTETSFASEVCPECGHPVEHTSRTEGSK